MSGDTRRTAMMDTNRFLSEVSKIEDAIKNMEAAVDAIERLQKNAINAVGSTEEKTVTNNLEETCFETNQIANMIRERLKQLEKAAGPSSKDAPMRRNQCSNLARNFMNVLKRYQKAQVGHEKSTKDRLKRQYKIVNPDATDKEIKDAINAENPDSIFGKNLLQSTRHEEAERALKEVQERHEQILRLAKSIQELEQLFLDMQSMVAAQDQIVVNIGNNVSQTRVTTAKATKEVKEAVRIRKMSKKKCLCLAIAITIVIIVIILIIYFTYFHPIAIQGR